MDLISKMAFDDEFFSRIFGGNHMKKHGKYHDDADAESCSSCSSEFDDDDDDDE